jgi:hypothetical protein
VVEMEVKKGILNVSLLSQIRKLLLPSSALGLKWLTCYSKSNVSLCSCLLAVWTVN